MVQAQPLVDTRLHDKAIQTGGSDRQEPREGSVWSLGLGRLLDLSAWAQEAASKRQLSKFYPMPPEPFKVKWSFFTSTPINSLRTPSVIFYTTF